MDPQYDKDQLNKYRKEFRDFRATRMGSTFFFVALVSLMFRTIIFPFLFAPISIFFAHMAKGTKKHNSWFNNLIILFSTVILIANMAYCGYVAYSVNHDTYFRRQMNQYTEQFYGMTFDDYLEMVKTQISEQGGAGDGTF